MYQYRNFTPGTQFGASGIHLLQHFDLETNLTLLILITLQHRKTGII